MATGTLSTPLVVTETACPPDCIEWPTWTPDGKAVFVRWIRGPQSIVVRNLETASEHELYRAASPARICHVAVSPDGRRVAFVWWDSEQGITALKVLSSAGGEPREIVNLSKPELSSYGQPFVALAWTPDSRDLIYASSTAGERRFEMMRISADGGEPQSLELAMVGLLPYGLSVHPDGRHIAFTAGTPEQSEVWGIENFLTGIPTGT